MKNNVKKIVFLLLTFLSIGCSQIKKLTSPHKELMKLYSVSEYELAQINNIGYDSFCKKYDIDINKSIVLTTSRDTNNIDKNITALLAFYDAVKFHNPAQEIYYDTVGDRNIVLKKEIDTVLFPKGSVGLMFVRDKNENPYTCVSLHYYTVFCGLRDDLLKNRKYRKLYYKKDLISNFIKLRDFEQLSVPEQKVLIDYFRDNISANEMEFIINMNEQLAKDFFYATNGSSIDKYGYYRNTRCQLTKPSDIFFWVRIDHEILVELYK